MLRQCFRSFHGVPAMSPIGIAATILAVLAGLTVAAPPNVIAFNAASGNLIANGDFSANAAAYTANPGYDGNGNPPAPTGWTVGPGQNTVGVNGSNTEFYKDATNGGAPFAPVSTVGIRDFVFLQNRGIFASQTVATVVGQTYTLTYDAAERINDTSALLKVVLINTATGRRITTRIPRIGQAAFRPFALQFTAPSSSTRIEFLNDSPAKSDNTVDVSNVAVVKGAQRALLSLDTQISPPSVKAIAVRVNRKAVFDGQCVVVSAMAERFKVVADVPFAPASMVGVGDFAFIQNGGGGPANSISQTVATTTGNSYKLAYDAAARRGETSDSLEVILTDASNDRQIITQTPAIADTAFNHFSLKFTAPSASTRIEFLNKSAVGTGLTVDVSNVALTAAGAGGARANLIANGDFSANAAGFINTPGYAPNPNSIRGWLAGRGSLTVGVNGAGIVFPIPVSGLKVRAYVNGKPWCAGERTLPSGVAHLLLPLPEVGANVITVRGGKVTSAPVTVRVKRRRFKMITDPKHLIGMDYETWFGPGYAQWGHEEAIPILGQYSSLDPRVLRQQTLWFNEMGINFVELDWTNNLTKPFPDSAARECIAAENALFHLYAHMRQHPKIVIMVGPEHNLWLNNHSTPYTGPWFEKQLNYLYAHYIHNPKYRNIYLRYHGKPLLMCYLNGPRFGRPPVIHDSRFTIRFMGAWLQLTREERYGAWSWYDQKATPTFYHGKAEALTVTDGYPGVNPPRTGGNLNYWLSPDAGGKNYGETYRTQWRVADKYMPHFLFLCQWNEFEPPDQYSVNLSNDMEPTLMTEPGSHRSSGWGFFYNNLTRREIQRYHRIIQALRGSR